MWENLPIYCLRFENGKQNLEFNAEAKPNEKEDEEEREEKEEEGEEVEEKKEDGGGWRRDTTINSRRKCSCWRS